MIITVICAAVGAQILVAVINFRPGDRQIFIAAVIALATCRCVWMLYTPLCYNVFFGYELDKALQLRRTAWSILDIPLIIIIMKYLGIEDDKKSSLKSESASLISSKVLARFGKSKNSKELEVEISSVKEKLENLKVELTALENMRFLAINTNPDDSSSGSGSANDSSNHSSGPNVDKGNLIQAGQIRSNRVADEEKA